MHQRRDRAERKAILETKGDVDQDRDQRVEHRETAVLGQLLADLRADEIDPAHVDVGFARRLEQADDLRTELGAILLGIGHQPDQHLAGAAEMLHDRVGEAAGREGCADRLELDRLRVADLDDAAAGKIDPEVETPGGETDDRHEQQRRRQQHRHLARLHEVDGIEA